MADQWPGTLVTPPAPAADPNAWPGAIATPPPVDLGTDIVRGLPGALAQGAVSLFGQGGDVRTLANRGAGWVASHLGASPETAAKIATPSNDVTASWIPPSIRSTLSAATNLPSKLPLPVRAALGVVNPAIGFGLGPTSQEVSDAAAPVLNKVPDINYQPQTTAGRITSTAASMWPAFFGNEGSAASELPVLGQLAPRALNAAGRVFNRMVVPAIGATELGDLAGGDPNSFTHQLAQLVGAIGAGTLAAGGRAAFQARDPTKVAGRLVSHVVNATGMTPDEIAAKGTAAGVTPAQGMTFGEAIGEPGINQMAALARREGNSATRYAQMIGIRSAQAADTLLNFFKNKIGIDPKLAAGDIEDVVNKGRQAVGPGWTDVLDNSPAPVSDKLDYLRQNSPLIKEAMNVGLRDAKTNADAAYVQGKAPAPFDPQKHGIIGFNDAGDPIVGPQPTMRMWHSVKTGLDDLLAPYRDRYSGQLDLSTDRARSINNMLNAVRGELVNVNPKYGQLLADSADYLSTREAFDRGGSITFNKDVPVADFKEAWDRLNPSQQQAFRGGIANHLFDWQQEGRLNKTYGLRADFISVPSTQQKLAIALGQDAADQLKAHIDVGTGLARSAARIAPGAGSQTQGLREAMNIQDATERAQRLAAMAGAVAHAAHGNVLGAGAGILGAFGMNASDLYNLGGRMSVAARNEAGRIFGMTPEEGAAYLRNQKPQQFRSGFTPGRTLLFAPGGITRWPSQLLGSMNAQPPT